MPDVAIIGAGPVGLSAALALCRLGVDVELFEAAVEPSLTPKASAFHPPTLEMFAEWNMLGDALEGGLRVHGVQYRDLRNDSILAELDYASIADITPYPYRLQLSQPLLEAILVNHIRRHNPGGVQYGAALTGIELREEHIALTLQIAHTTEMVFAKYVLAADGEASPSRTALGVRFLGKSEAQRYLLVGTDLDLVKYRPGISDVACLRDAADACEVMRVPGCLHALFRLHAGESEKDALNVASVGRRLGLLARAEIDRVEINHYAVYTVQQRVAEKFRVGNAFLLGDAAHVTTPVEGIGINGGIHDAYEIAWRIALALGGASDSIFDGYERRRRRTALEYIDAESERSPRDDNLEALAASPRERRRVLLRSSMLV